MSEDESPITKLPRPIAEGFFSLAEEEAKRVKERILRSRIKVKKIRDYLKFKKIKEGNSNVRLLVVDGSKSREPEERIGSKTVLIAVAYMLFDGTNLIEQDAKTFKIVLSSYGQYQNTYASIIMHLMERTIALEKLKEFSPEFLLIDGSFFGFRVNCQRVRNMKGYYELGDAIVKGNEVVDELVNITKELIKSKKTIGIIKRSSLSAIDGWLLYNLGEEFMINSTDKFILTLLMNEKSYWEYKSLVNEPEVYTRFASTYHYWSKEKGYDKDMIFEQAKEGIERLYKLELGVEKSKLPKRERGFLRYFIDAPPFEVEYPIEIDIEEICSKLSNFINKASGLPFPIDLVDSYVSLPIGTTSAFVQEVEAKILGDENIFPSEVSSYFSHLNPQKPQWI